MKTEVSANPFTISFGMEPLQYIRRPNPVHEVESTFTAGIPSNHVFIISGTRGIGKTVLLTEISTLFSEKKDWIVINASSDTDIVTKVAAKLYSKRELKNLFSNAKLDFSALGFGITVEGGHQIFEIETALEEMLSEIKKKKKKVLILIDEIISNSHVQIFSSTFQLLIREKLPVFLIMTGLYENISNLQNEKNLTFLYRAPKIALEPLSLNSIAGSYENIIDLDEYTAGYMARLTKGYPFAYQILGYLYWKEYREKEGSGDVKALLPSFDEYLENYVYEKVWMELSPKERTILSVLNDEKPVKIKDIREKIDLSSGEMSVYRDRLNKKGLLDTSIYGYLSPILPRFCHIIRFWVDE